MAEDPTPTPAADPTPAVAPAPAAAVTVADPAKELATAREAVKGATEVARKALQSANPDLPPAAFEGEDVNAIEKSMASARAVADFAVAKHKEAAPTAPTTPADAGTNRSPVVIGDNVRGSSRISAALERGDKLGE